MAVRETRAGLVTITSRARPVVRGRRPFRDECDIVVMSCDGRVSPNGRAAAASAGRVSTSVVGVRSREPWAARRRAAALLLRRVLAGSGRVRRLVLPGSGRWGAPGPGRPRSRREPGGLRAGRRRRVAPRRARARARGTPRAVAGLGARAVRDALVAPRHARARGRTRPRPPTLAHAGQHVVVATGTASGKSLAYLLPVLDRAAPPTRGPRRSTSSPPRRWPPTSCAPLADARRCPGVRPAALRRRHPAARNGTGSAGTPATCSPTRTCCTARMLPRHARWATVPAPAALRRRRRVPHLPRRVRLARGAACCAGCAGSAPGTAPPPTSCWPRPPSADPADVAGPAHRPAGRRGHRRRLTARRRTAFALWEPPLLPELGRRARRAGPARRGRRDRRPAGRPRRSRACARSPSSGPGAAPRWSPLTPDGLARRGRPGAGRPGGRLPRRLPARGAARAGAGLRSGRAARARRHQRARARHRRRRAGRRADRRLPRHPRVALAAGRPGRPRRARRRSAVLVARDDPLDTYLVHHPEALFGRPVEATRARPGQPVRPRPAPVRAPPPSCRSTEADLRAVRRRGDRQAARRAGRPAGCCGGGRPGWFWTRRERAADLADIRGTGRRARSGVVEAGTGRLLGTVDAGVGAPPPSHAGAVYLHQGETLPRATSSTSSDAVALVEPSDPDWTHRRPRRHRRRRASSRARSRAAAPVGCASATVE